MGIIIRLGPLWIRFMMERQSEMKLETYDGGTLINKNPNGERRSKMKLKTNNGGTIFSISLVFPLKLGINPYF